MAKVQFIGYQIQTAAKGNVAELRARQKYPGLADQKNDIDARCRVLADAIECAAKNFHLDREALKVFVAPEFFFRGGTGGVYDIENVSLIAEKMDNWLSMDAYKKWIFVLGSALAVMPGGPPREILNAALVRRGGIKVTGKNVNVGAGDSVVVYKEYISAVDFLGQYFGDKNAFLETQATAGLANIQGSEQRLIPVSGSRPKDAATVLSNPDAPNIHGANRTFPSAKFTARVLELLMKGKITAADRDRLLTPRSYTTSEKSASGLGGGINFTMAGLNFILEVCLDHAQGRAYHSLDASTIDIHLVSSCGMAYCYQHVKAGGYFFLVDGAIHHRSRIDLRKSDGGRIYQIVSAIDMTNSSNWKNFLGPATNLFQEGRGTVYIYPKQYLP